MGVWLLTLDAFRTFLLAPPLEGRVLLSQIQDFMTRSRGGLPDVLGRFSARGRPWETHPGSRRAGRHEHSVFVLFQIHAILHHPTILTKPAAPP